jgi:hypothetical protein
MKILSYGIVLLFMVTLWGCSQGNSNAPVTIDPITKKHPVGWALDGTGGAHPLAYFSAPTSCEGCHGLPSDPAGGISGVSCSNPGRSGVACHPAFPHAIGFSRFDRHGNAAKDTASGVTGMAHCKQCHGSSYTGAGLAPSCVKCHNDYNASNHAPHAANWVAGNVNGLKHSTTVANNAPACFQCHAGGTYSHPAPVPAPPGTEPGCFNGTMCHNTAGHAFTYAGHMIPARSNLASCQPCHAIPASGPNPSYTVPKNALLSPNGCEKCHYKVSGTPSGLAHPYMWLPGRGNPGQQSASHVNAGTVNASCGLCHGGSALAGGGSGPSCFSPQTSINGTTCHFTKPVDAAGITVGCVSCHGSPPNGVAAPNRAYRHTPHFSATANLAGLTCSACHTGFGSPLPSHATETVFSPMTAPTAIDPKFYENGLPGKYNPVGNAGKCENVSCHGGKITPFPVWKSATALLVNDGNRCAFTCHTISTVAPASYAGPYIGPFSGIPISAVYGNLHNAHANILGPTLLCAKCHLVPGTVHWANIMLGHRTLAPGFAAGTIGGASTQIVTYTPGTGSCLSASVGCHGTPADPKYKWY